MAPISLNIMLPRSRSPPHHSATLTAADTKSIRAHNSDRGSDFMSNHIEQESIDLKFERIQTEPDDPQGKGKCERFFKTLNEMFLSSLPGYAPKGHSDVQPVLTLEQLEEKLKSWLLAEYFVRK